MALTPGTSAQAYADALGAGLGQPYQVNANGSNSSQFFVIIGLIATLTLLLAAVAALGVLNTVVLQTRERVHDLGRVQGGRHDAAADDRHGGVLGGWHRPGRRPDRDPGRDRPAQLRAAGHGHAAQTDVPPSVLNAYHAWEIVLLALSGLVIAVAGALGPAGWAARTRTAFALRAE